MKYFRPKKCVFAPFFWSIFLDGIWLTAASNALQRTKIAVISPPLSSERASKHIGPRRPKVISAPQSGPPSAAVLSHATRDEAPQLSLGRAP